MEENRQETVRAQEVGRRESRGNNGDPHVRETSAGLGDVEQQAVIEKRMKAAERAAQTTSEMKNPDLVRIEEMLSHGLADEYAQLSSEQKQRFRKEGEALATWLDTEFRNKTARAHEVLARTERWLLIIENKNRASPWLLQEAYVKARRILTEMMYFDKGN